jgi:hypothetical protein
MSRAEDDCHSTKLALFPPLFSDRANRGLLVEARAPEEAGASLATGTQWTSASALAAMQPTNDARWPERRTGLVRWDGGNAPVIGALIRHMRLSSDCTRLQPTYKLRRESNKCAAKLSNAMTIEEGDVEAPGATSSKPDAAAVHEFKRDADFPALMTGAHRKPSPQVGSPAITQHLGFWIPDEIQDRDAWVGNIEDFILSLYDRLIKLAGEDEARKPFTPNLQSGDSCLYLLDNKYPVDPKTGVGNPPKERKRIGTYPNRYQTVRFAFPWKSASVEVNFELHNEYFTLSNTLDLSQKELDASWNLATSVNELNAFATERFAKIKNEQEPNKAPDTLRSLCHTIYEAVWEEFFDEFFQKKYSELGAKKLGNVFVDFRGLVNTRGEPEFIVPPGKFNKQEDRISPSLAYTGNDDLYSVDAILPFLRASVGEPPQRYHRPTDRIVEYTFSKFQTGRLIYGTALGVQPSQLQAAAKPLTYVIICTHGDPWQMGRFVDRMHTLGTLRLAALYDLPRIVQANSALRRREGILEGIEKDVAALKVLRAPRKRVAKASYALSKKNDKEGQDRTIRSLFERLSISSRELAAIATGDPGAGSSHAGVQQSDGVPTGKATKVWRPIKGGLAYRVERAQYYRLQFLHLLGNRGIERIAGFQPYDQFVERRLGATYDFIRMVGLRFDRFEKGIATLNRQLAGLELLRLQDEIKGQTGTIEKFQQVGEIGFWAFLFPYYVSNVAIHVAEHIYVPEQTDIPGKVNVLEKFPGLELGILVLAIAIGAIRAVRAYYRPKEEDASDNEEVENLERTEEPGLTGIF